MKQQLSGFRKVGGYCAVASGILFLIRGILDFLSGPPPSSGSEILSWAASHSLLIAFQDEATFFAAILLVPALAVLYRAVRGEHRLAAVAGSGITATAIPILMSLVIVQGRLVYPVFGINVNSPGIAEFVVALFYGGLHAVDIIIGIGAFVLGFSMRGEPHGRLIVALAVLIGLIDIVGAYPYIIGPVGTLICQMFFSLWFIVLGSILLSSAPKTER